MEYKCIQIQQQLRLIQSAKSQGALIRSASKSHVVPVVEFELRSYRVPCVLFRECHSWSAVDDTSIVFFSFSPVISDFPPPPFFVCLFLSVKSVCDLKSA